MKKVLFGKYFSDIDTLEELSWIVLNETEEGALFLCENVIESMRYAYEENEIDNPVWENCVIRTWLNNYFLDSFFTTKEQNQILPQVIITEEGTKLIDKVFLLSKEEVEAYLPNKEERRARPTDWARRNEEEFDGLVVIDGYCTWLLRDTSKACAGNWTGISSKGELDLTGADFYYGPETGVRPALFLKKS